MGLKTFRSEDAATWSASEILFYGIGHRGVPADIAIVQFTSPEGGHHYATLTKGYLDSLDDEGLAALLAEVLAHDEVQGRQPE